MDYLIKTYGAVGDGVTDDAPAIQKAIDACYEAGGGRVVCQSGTYLCSTIVLKSNVEFHLENGCVICSSLDSCCYQDENAALLTSYGEKNIAITGFGVIDGRSQLIFYDDNQDPLHEAPLDYPVGAFRPRTSMFEDVENITVRDVTFKNSVFWTLHFAGCRGVIVSGVRILNDIRSNENDGIDPDCCKNVVISDCIITSGDDPVVLKATKPMAEKYGNCENIVVNNCVFKTKSAGIKIGTETWADIKNITVSNCVIEECGRAVAIWARDGGTVSNVNISNVRATCRAYNACKDNKHIGAGYPYWWGKGEAIYISNTLRTNEGTVSGNIRDIMLDGLQIDSESSVFVCGSEYGETKGITLRNSKIRLSKRGSQTPGWFDLRPSPMDIFEHSIPGIYVESAEEIDITDVAIELSSEEKAYDAVAEFKNVKGVTIDALRGTPAKENVPAVRIENVEDFDIINIKTSAAVKLQER